jgi:threonine dehydrogenase-like Zn-dependent dehydrogenase
MNYKSFWHLQNNHSEIISETIEMPNLDKIEIKSLYSSISLGTEKIVSQGKVPTILYEKMAVPYMAGSFEFPIKYGYSLVGNNHKGELIHLMHPHQTTCWVEEKDCFVCSDQSNPILTTQLANMETVINAIWVSNVQPNQKVLVCGLGSVGVLLAEALRSYCNAEVYVKEKDERKIATLAKNGFSIPDETDKFPLSFHTSASEIGLQYCIDHSTEEGKIIELSWYGNHAIQLTLGGNFHYNRLQIISAQVSNIPFIKKNSEDFFSRKKLAEKLVHSIPINKYISLITFDELPEFFNQKTNANFITVVKY